MLAAVAIEYKYLWCIYEVNAAMPGGIRRALHGESAKRIGATAPKRGQSHATHDDGASAPFQENIDLICHRCSSPKA